MSIMYNKPGGSLHYYYAVLRSHSRVAIFQHRFATKQNGVDKMAAIYIYPSELEVLIPISAWVRD